MRFNADMDYGEAQYLLFSLSKDITVKEREELFKEYSAVLPSIIEKELDGTPKFTEYIIPGE